jgi:hypothetical protein
MLQPRFFEDREGDPDVNDGRRLLLGLMTSEGPADGGTREAVRVATVDDVATYAAAYALYFEAAGAAEPPQTPLAGDQRPAGEPAAEPSVAAAVAAPG